jgi:hypothetical protein
MGSLTDRERELRIKLATNFEAYAAACLKIRTKRGAVEPLKLNRSQRFVHERLEKQRREKGRVRALVLKGRQVGISTYISGRFYWRTSHSRGCRTFILAHLDDASSNLFTMAKRFHEHVPEMMRPETGAANAKELVFSRLDSGYKVSTAGSQAVGRSDTIQLFHGSEMAFWPNAEEHSAGLVQAIADAPGTEDIRESTANGIGNAFHNMWVAAERGDSEFEPIFVPWFWHEEYVTEVPAGWTPPDAFREYGERYGLTPEQTYWAFRKNREAAIVAGGSPDEINWKFRQEYPANAAEAFQTSGADSFIRPELVLSARKCSVSGYGPIILGVDPARGGGDKTGVVDRQGRRLGGNICKLIDSNDLMATAGEIQAIARQIKPAKVVIDTTGLGAGLYDRLREIMGDLVEGVNFASKAYAYQQYANRRAEMWDLMRQWFEDPAGVQVPDDDVFQGNMCSIIRGQGATRFNSNGQLILEPKEHVRERLSFSPDLADAAALTFAIDFDALAESDFRPTPNLGSGSWMSV